MEKKAILKVQRENRVTAGDTIDKVVLEGVYVALGRVCLVQVGGYKLKCNSLAALIIFEAGWTFIVEHLELGAIAPIS